MCLQVHPSARLNLRTLILLLILPILDLVFQVRFYFCKSELNVSLVPDLLLVPVSLIGSLCKDSLCKVSFSVVTTSFMELLKADK